MNISHNLYSDGEFDLRDGDFAELFFENFAEYEKALMEVKQPLLDHYDEVVKNIRNIVGEDYMVVEFRDTLVFKIRHIELNQYVLRFELHKDKNWFVQESSGNFIESFDDMYDEDGEDEFNSLMKRVGSFFNRHCEQQWFIFSKIRRVKSTLLFLFFFITVRIVQSNINISLMKGHVCARIKSLNNCIQNSKCKDCTNTT